MQHQKLPLQINNYNIFEIVHENSKHSPLSQQFGHNANAWISLQLWTNILWYGDFKMVKWFP